MFDRHAARYLICPRRHRIGLILDSPIQFGGSDTWIGAACSATEGADATVGPLGGVSSQTGPPAHRAPHLAQSSNNSGTDYTSVSLQTARMVLALAPRSHKPSPLGPPHEDMPETTDWMDGCLPREGALPHVLAAFPSDTPPLPPSLALPSVPTTPESPLSRLAGPSSITSIHRSVPTSFAVPMSASVSTEGSCCTLARSLPQNIPPRSPILGHKRRNEHSPDPLSMEPNDDDDDFWGYGSSDDDADATAHSGPPSDDEWDDQEEVEATEGDGPHHKEHSFLDDQLLFELEAPLNPTLMVDAAPHSPSA